MRAMEGCFPCRALARARFEIEHNSLLARTMSLLLRSDATHAARTRDSSSRNRRNAASSFSEDKTSSSTVIVVDAPESVEELATGFL